MDLAFGGPIVDVNCKVISGIPDPVCDQRLGDCVVSKPNNSGARNKVWHSYLLIVMLLFCKRGKPSRCNLEWESLLCFLC